MGNSAERGAVKIRLELVTRLPNEIVVRELGEHSLRDIAAQAGITHSFLSQILRGKRRASLDTADKLGRVFGVPGQAVWYWLTAAEAAPAFSAEEKEVRLASHLLVVVYYSDRIIGRAKRMAGMDHYMGVDVSIGDLIPGTYPAIAALVHRLTLDQLDRACDMSVLFLQRLQLLDGIPDIPPSEEQATELQKSVAFAENTVKDLCLVVGQEGQRNNRALEALDQLEAEIRARIAALRALLS